MRTSSAPEHSAPPGWWIWTVRLLAAAALVISGYLFLASRGATVTGCSGDAGCGAVLASRWSRWFSVPVSVPAAACYFAVLLATGLLQKSARLAWMSLVAFAVAITGAALWFVALQAWVLHRFCPYCTAAHACGLALSALVLAGAFREWRARREDGATRVSISHLAAGGALGAVGVALLIAGQWFARPAGAVIAFEKTTIRIEREAFPSIGKPGAEKFAAVFVDYTCDHCRDLHRILAGLLAKHPNVFEMVILPLPLDAACNRTLRVTPPHHENACTLARLALAVWRADASKFPEMDAWLFDGLLTPMPSSARRHAVGLIGEAALRKAEADPVVAATISRSIETFTRAGGRQIPVLMAGGQTWIGPIAGQADAEQRIEELLGLRAR